MHGTEYPITNKKRSRLKKSILWLAYNTGLFRFGRQLWSKSLTVLNYHRINDITQPDFDSFKPNVSASPTEFDRQMSYIKRWFNVIGINDLVRWLEGDQSLPPYAALITFDDGYLDNYSYAFPILQKYNFQAVIYLASGHIGTNQPFFWDLAAYCFFHTQCDRVSFPNGTEQRWTTPYQREQVLTAWIEALKSIPESEKQLVISHLPDQLKVSIPNGYFRNLMMSWDQVREIGKKGIDFGGHTINHPILTRVSPEIAQAEIKGSKEMIEKELGQPVLSFAYPNGMTKDLNTEIEKITARAGYKAAFSLLNGPSLLGEVKRSPFAIRRIFISHNHTLPEFSTLLSPINRYRS